MAAEVRGPRLAGGVLASILLHGGLVVALFSLRSPPMPSLPPTYRVQLFAAPAGDRAIGVVQATPSSAPPVQVPELPKQQLSPVPAARGRKAPAKQVTEVPRPVSRSSTAKSAPAPEAGGGETGGRGADVANLETPGLDFPFPVYARNIVNQIIARFRPRARGPLVARVRFMIRRDGSVPIESIQLDSSSGSFSFNQDALAAVEQASRLHAFGPLPDGFREDVLPVFFRFDPSVIH